MESERRIFVSPVVLMAFWFSAAAAFGQDAPKASLQASGQSQAASAREVEKTIEAQGRALDRADLKRLVWRAEDLHLDEIRRNGPGERLVVTGFYPDYEGKIEITCPEDLRGLCPVFALIHPDAKPGDAFVKTGGGTEPDRCVLRFSGRVPGKSLPYRSYNRFWPDVTSVFESLDQFPNQLTFAYLKGIGYVYLRGKGKVIFPTGREVSLGQVK